MGKGIDEIIEELQGAKKKTTFKRLVTVMESAGCRARSNKDGCVISHSLVRKYRVTVARPHGKSGGKYVKAPYIGYCVRLLGLVKDAEEEQ